MAERLTADHVAEVERIVRRRAGLTLQATLAETKFRCVAAAFQRSGRSRAEDYLAQLRTDARLLDDLLDELTIGETYFFRIPGHFDLLASEIFPEIFRRRGEDHVIRFWSAGCATGEEPYSVAIQAARLGWSDRVRVLATDVSRRLLARAQAGRFSEWALRDRGVEALDYLTLHGKVYEIDRRLREQIIFAYLNLASDAYPSIPQGIWGMDVIFCRNVLIYFDRDTIRSVARRLHDSLAAGGWLITAAADPSLRDYAPFETVVTEHGTFYRRALSEEFLRADPSQVFASPPPEALVTEPAIAPRVLKSASPRPARSPLRTYRPPPVPSSPVEAEASPLGERLQQLLLLGHAAEAARLIDEALVRHPLRAELYYWSAVLLLERGEDVEALRRLSRALYLDRKLLVAHFVQGLVLQRRGEARGALRAFENVCQLCRELPGDAVVPFAEGQLASTLGEVAAAQKELLRRV